MIKSIIILILISANLTCQKQYKSTNTQAPRQLKTKGGKTVVLSEAHPNGMSLSEVKIIVKGFKQDQIIDPGITGPVQDVELADLDRDGFDELYIFSVTAGSGSAGEVLIYDIDRSLRRLEVDSIKGNQAEGYFGHDLFSIVKDTLVREFPVYRAGDPNSSPSGGTKKISYRLIGGKMEIVKIEIRQ
jgi:hypothetical protein